MGKYHDKRFPRESDEYRRARDALLASELELRKQIEAVAALRRSLPQGGKLGQDYVFDEAGSVAGASDATRAGQRRFSELFEAGKNSLVIYSFMFAPDAEQPCPMCTSILDSLDGCAPHAQNRINLVVVAKAPIERIRGWASQRGWRNLRLLSSGGNTYNADHHAETADGAQWPAVNVFRKTAAGIFHFYNAELFYAPAEQGMQPRHVDLIWPLWNLFDLTPEVRGTNWYPRISYD